MTQTTFVRHRMLGGVLREYRELQGLAMETAASILDCDISKISRIENGMRGIRPKEIRELLSEYGVAEPERDALAALARPVPVGGWWRDYAGVLSSATHEYVQLEAAASRIEVYEPQLVPALLQTPGYADAVAGSWLASGEQGDALAALTAARQDAALAELAVVIDEAILHRQAGGPHVMRAQLLHLAEAAGGAEPGITVRVVPFADGTRTAYAGGPVTILRFAAAPRVGVVWIPRPGADGTCLVSRDDLATYTKALTTLTAAALTPAESAQLIRELATSYGAPDACEGKQQPVQPRRRPPGDATQMPS